MQNERKLALKEEMNVHAKEQQGILLLHPMYIKIFLLINNYVSFLAINTAVTSPLSSSGEITFHIDLYKYQRNYS